MDAGLLGREAHGEAVKDVHVRWDEPGFYDWKMEF